VESNHSAFRKIGREKVEVLFTAAVGVVAIDPKEADGAIPSGSNIAGEGTADFNILFDPPDLREARNSLKVGSSYPGGTGPR